METNVHKNLQIYPTMKRIIKYKLKVKKEPLTLTYLESHGK